MHHTAPTQLYTPSLTRRSSDLGIARPIAHRLDPRRRHLAIHQIAANALGAPLRQALVVLETPGGRSEEHTSELQSRGHLVCRLLLEKKKQNSESAAVPSDAIRD